MPVRSCQSSGKPGYKWGNAGKCYTYPPGNESARKKAKQKAHIQGYAIEKSKAANSDAFGIDAFFEGRRLFSMSDHEDVEFAPVVFQVHAVDTSERHIEIMDGEEFLVIPVVAAVEGVLNNYYLPIESIEASLPAWEGVPVTLSHPKQYGQDISANTKFAKENYCVGFFFNAHIDEDKFKGEFWIQLSSLNNKDDGQALLNKLDNDEVVEVSTAYWCQTNGTTGVYKGKSYEGIQFNLVPNHVAILVNEIGACSVVDGCGTPRTNSKEEDMDKGEIQTNCEKRDGFLQKLKNSLGEGIMHLLNANRMSFGDIERKLREEISKNERSDTFIWVLEVYDNEVVYGREFANGEVDLLSSKYSIGSSPGYDVSLEDPVQVDRVVTYEPRTNSSQEEDNMNREQLIERLATNDKVPFSRDALTAMKDDELNYLVSNLEDDTAEPAGTGDDKNKSTEATVEPSVTEPAPVVQDQQVQQNNNKLSDDVVARLNELGSDGISQILNSAKELQQQRKDQKDAIISRLVANQACTIPESSLRNMDLEGLQGVAKMLQKSNFGGAGGPVRFDVNSEDRDVPAPPSCVLPDAK